MTAAFVNLWNSRRIKSQNNLQLPNGIPSHMLYFPEQLKGGMQKDIQVTTELLQEAFTQTGLSIDNGSTAFNFMDKEFLRNCDHFLPDPIEIPSNEEIEAYPFLKYKFLIENL